MRFGFGVLIISIIASTALGQTPDRVAFTEGNDSLRIEKMVAHADSLKRIGQIQQSTELLKKFQATADSLENAYLIQLVDAQLADNYLSGSRYQKAEQLLSATLERYPHGSKKAELLSLLGNAYRYQGQYKEALAKQEEAMGLIDSVRHPGIYARLNLNIASVHSDMGNFGPAFKYFSRSIEAAEATGDSVLQATALNNLGVLYNDHQQSEDAKYYLRRALAIDKKINNKVGMLRATLNLAISFHKLNNYDKAISLYNQALDLHRDVRPNIPPFRILYNLGQLHKEQGHYDKAIDYYQQSLNYSKQQGIAQGLIYNYGGLGDVAEQQGRYPEAATYYSKALDIARKIGEYDLEKNALQSLYSLKKSVGAYQEALSFHEAYVELSDSLQEVFRQEQIDKTKVQLGLQKQQDINHLLQEKQRQQETLIATQYWLIVAGIVIIVIILISLYLLYKSNAEKQRINAELEAQRSQLQELNKVKDKMLAIIAHDLRSPMASMQGMLYLIREEDLSADEISGMAAKLEVSLNQNISMMDNLLAWAREQMVGLEVDIERIQAREVVEEVFDNLCLQAQDKGITLHNNIAEDVVVWADENLLKLILRNLISNSIKFSKQGDEISVQGRRGSSGKILFEVCDTGIGIPEDKQQAIFSMEGESRLGTEDEQGSGLGLRLCKEFIEKQDGEISVQSTEGEGTTFTFCLPKAS